MKAKSDQVSQLQHFQEEHQQLAEQLGRVQSLLAERARNAEDIGRRMQTLGSLLDEHFREEEAEFFQQIVAQAPQLSSRVERLQAEHKKLRQLYAACQQAIPRETSQVAGDFHDFSKLLMEHETRESEILQDAYDDDIGSQD